MREFSYERTLNALSKKFTKHLYIVCVSLRVRVIRCEDISLCVSLSMCVSLRVCHCLCVRMCLSLCVSYTVCVIARACL